MLKKEKQIIIILLLIIISLPVNLYSYYDVNRNVVTSIPEHKNPYNSPSYDNGFGDGYIDGYKDSYPDAYLRAKHDNGEDGKKNGKNDGFNNYIEKFLKYKLPGKTLIELLNEVEIGYLNSEKLCEVNFNGGKDYYSQGYNDGIVMGRKDGKKNGQNDGHSEEYKREYGKSYNEGYETGLDYIYYDGDRKLDLNDQFQLAMEAFNNKNYKEAIIRFNIVLMEDKIHISPQLKLSAIWWLALSKENYGETNEAARLFLIHYKKNPEINSEEVILNISRNLLEIKTKSGFGKKKYYNRVISIMKWWLEKFKESSLYPEGLFILAEAYDSIRKPDMANEIYQKIVKKYPGTAFAKEAKTYLEQ